MKFLGLILISTGIVAAQSPQAALLSYNIAGTTIVPKDTGNSLCVLGTLGVAAITFNSTGHFFHVYASAHPASLPLSIADNKGNTANYVSLTPTSAGTAPNGHHWFLRNATIGTSHTVTVTGAGGLLVSACVQTFDGLANTGVVDQENHAAGVTGTGCQAGSITPGANNSLIVVGISYEITVSVTSIGSGFSIAGTADGSPGVAYGVGVGYLAPQAIAASVDPAWVVNLTSTKDCVIASFK